MNFLIFLVGNLSGLSIFYGLFKLDQYLSLKKLQDEYNTFYNEINSLIGTNSFKFISRFNELITFKVNTPSIGNVNLIINLVRGDISVWEKDQLLYTSNYVDPQLLTEIFNKIISYYSLKINDCFKVMENIVDKATIKKMNPDIIFPEAFPKPDPTFLDIDIVLDKISEVGMNNLTIDEKEFLENYQKNLK